MISATPVPGASGAIVSGAGSPSPIRGETSSCT